MIDLCMSQAETYGQMGPSAVKFRPLPVVISIDEDVEEDIAAKSRNVASGSRGRKRGFIDLTHEINVPSVAAGHDEHIDLSHDDRWYVRIGCLVLYDTRSYPTSCGWVAFACDVRTGILHMIPLM
jgi:hypothetical protein